MKFIQPCFIRKNTPELRERLKELGYNVCACSTFKHSVWLDTSVHTEPCSVHGIGYWDETCDCTTEEEACRMFLEENKTSLIPKIDCGTDEELFLALAAMTDDPCNPLEHYTVTTSSDTYKRGQVARFLPLMSNIHPSCYRKATAQEIVEQFKKEETK